MFGAPALCKSQSFTAAVILGAAAILTGVGRPAEAAPARQMPTATGRVTYQISGPMKGSMVLSWSENGKKFRQETKMTGVPPPATPGAPKAAPMSMDTWMLSDGKAMYALMPMGGKKVMRLEGKTSGPAGAPMGLGQMLGDLGGPSGGKVVGKATLLGRSCEIRATDKGKVWLWKGLPLRMEIQVNPKMPKLTMVATKVESAPKLPAILFKVPAGYQIQEMPAGGPRMPPGMPRR